MEKKAIRRPHSSGHIEVIAGIAAGLVIAMLTVVSMQLISAKTAAPAESAASSPQATGQIQRRAPHFASVHGTDISPDARFLADWIADSGDAGGRQFVIIDKKGARVYVFDRDAQLMGASPVLLGVAPGDETVPGIGDKPLSEVKPEERTTPAGRFLGERGHNARGEDVVWVDYDAAVSMHRVLTTNRAERRLERLASPSIEDNRVSYGCVNVPVSFYEKFVRPAFAREKAMIYVLPEVKSLKQVFNNVYDVAAVHRVDRDRAVRAPDGNALFLFLYALRS
jgi:hypothetical protein